MNKYTSVLRTFVCILTLAFGATACGGYKINILQGNFIDQKKVDQINDGMTRNQVKYLLGTPMIKDSFHEDRWDYVYQAKFGKTGQIIQRKITVFFDGDSVRNVEQYGQNPAASTDDDKVAEATPQRR